MSRLNYNSLLEYLEISHGQFIIILIVLFLVFSLVYFLYKLGLLTRIKFTEVKLSPSHLVFISYQGSYDQIQSAFMDIIQDIQAVFKVSDPFGIYYDNPKEMENPD